MLVTCPDPLAIRRFVVRAGLVVLTCSALLSACAVDDLITSRQTVNVTVVGEGNGSGTVVATDPAVDIDCTITDGTAAATGCETEFQDAGNGGTFNLVATPSAGSTFTRWGSECTTPSGTTCTLSFAVGPALVKFDVGATFSLDAPSSSCTVGTTISDQFGSDAGWTVTPVVSGGSPTQTVSFQTTGGVSGGYRRMQHIFPAVGEIYVYHDYTTTTYNPATQGAIDHINYFEAQIEFDPPSPGDQIGTGFTMTQGSTRARIIMRPPNGYFTNTAWESTSRLDLTAANFPGIDFTVTGGSITFGYYRANTNTGGGAATLTHGIDNWQVDICR